MPYKESCPFGSSYVRYKPNLTTYLLHTVQNVLGKLVISGHEVVGFYVIHCFASSLKGPKHDQVEGEFFYIKQTRMVR